MIHQSIPSRFFHSSGIKWIQCYGMCITILTLEGDFYALRADSLLPISQLVGSHLRFAAIFHSVYSLHPLLLFIQDDESHHRLYSSYLMFGTPTIIAEEWNCPNLHMVSSGVMPVMICVQPNSSSFTLRLFLLTASTCHQHFRNIILMMHFLLHNNTTWTRLLYTDGSYNNFLSSGRIYPIRIGSLLLL